jgi:hypothetical protein
VPQLSTNIISVCKPTKLGLMDLAEALTFYGSKNDRSRRYLILNRFFDIFTFFLKNRTRNIFVIWDNSPRSLIVMLICFLLRMKTIYYLHEPGGFKHKRQLRATFFYSLFASLNELICKLLSNYIGISRADKIEHGDYFLPLLYDNRRPKHSPKNIIGFVGSQKKERIPDVFRDVALGLKSFGYDTGYFPSAEHGSSLKEKLDFLAKCSAVWNVFIYEYNLSGVTGDAFMSAVPLIVSDHEPFINLLLKNNLAIRVDINDTSDEFLVKIIKYMNSHKNSPNQKSLQNDQSLFGGATAFIDCWKVAFDNIESVS